MDDVQRHCRFRSQGKRHGLQHLCRGVRLLASLALCRCRCSLSTLTTVEDPENTELPCGLTNVVFDLFGLLAELYTPIAQATANRRSLVTFTRTLQDLTTDVCGDYCILFCMAVTRELSLDDFVLYWMDSGDDRDSIMRCDVDERLRNSGHY